jgi:hypothetical protein
MTSKVTVQSGICGFETTIEAKATGSGVVEIKIESQCKSVQTYAEKLLSATTEDLTDWEGSKVIELAGKTGLTTTCLIPTAVFNVCWVEIGMISRKLAMDKGPLCIHFVE